MVPDNKIVKERKTEIDENWQVNKNAAISV